MFHESINFEDYIMPTPKTYFDCLLYDLLTQNERKLVKSVELIRNVKIKDLTLLECLQILQVSGVTLSVLEKRFNYLDAV